MPQRLGKYLLLAFLLSMIPSNLNAEESVFNAAWWCPGAHAQTICGNFTRHAPKFFYRRERIDLPDGDFIDLDWYDADPKAPTVFILHGLAGNSESTSIKIFVKMIHDKGLNAVVMNARGQSGELNRLAATSHGGRSQDLQWAVYHVLFTRNVKKMYLVGFSIGGNVLLKWLGENAQDVPPAIDRTVVVSTPFDLERVAHLLDKNWFNRNVYVRSLLRVLKPLAIGKAKQFPGLLNVRAIEKANTFEVYDREVTAKINGFKNEKEYWEKSSAIHYLKDIKTPVLIIHAANDPFFPAEYFPFDTIKNNPHLHVLMTSDGGHLGFVAGNTVGRPEPWLENRIIGYFEKNDDIFYEEFPQEKPLPTDSRPSKQ